MDYVKVIFILLILVMADGLVESIAKIFGL